MRILLLNQFYPPDTAPTGQYLHDLARTLAGRGHQVKVMCSRRSYNGAGNFSPQETRDGVEITRLPATGFGRQGSWGRILDYASFCCSLLFSLTAERKRPHLIVSLTSPPYLGVLGKLASVRHRCRHANWVMDLYPDVLFAHGVAGKNGMVRWVLEKLAKFQLRGSEPVVALGPVMALRVAAYAGKVETESSVAAIPLWSDPELEPWPVGEPNPLRIQRGWNRKDVVFLYSGNMGLGHRLHDFLEAANRLGESGPRWVFSGGGKRRAEVEAFARENPNARIELLDYAPRAQLRAHLCAADVHLASLDAAWEGSIVPSKLQASFAVGRPVIYLGSRRSETAAWVEESGGGWVVHEDDLPGLLRAVEQALNVEERRQRGVAAHEYARKKFQMTANCTQLAIWLEGSSEV